MHHGSPQRTSGSVSPPSRTLSPASLQNGRVMSPPVGPGIMDGMSRMGLGQDSRVSPHPPPDPRFPTRTSSTGGGMGPGSSFTPGQIVPGPGFGPGSVMPPPSFGPGQMMHMPPPPGPPGPGSFVPPPRGASNTYRGPGGPPGGPPMGLPSRPAPSPMQYGPGPGPRTSNMSDGSGSNGRPPSDGSYASVRKSPSSRSLASQFEHMQANGMPPPPMPGYPEDLQPPRPNFIPRTGSSSSLNSLQAPQPRPLLPSAQMRSVSTAVSFIEPSPPNSPVEETPRHVGPTTSTISAQMKCKVFLKQAHAAWKSLGAAKLKLYRESPTNIKQLVVEADNSKKTVLISTIVLEDGVERVGKTGVAIELSDQGQRTGIVYMLQLRNESSAGGLFDSLLAGSDRFEAGRS